MKLSASVIKRAGSANSTSEPLSLVQQPRPQVSRTVDIQHSSLSPIYRRILETSYSTPHTVEQQIEPLDLSMKR